MLKQQLKLRFLNDKILDTYSLFSVHAEYITLPPSVFDG